jgi:hypothetical protein
VELKTSIISGKRRTDLQDPREDPRAGICEVSKQNVQWVSEMDLVERSAPSETEKEILYGVGAGNVGASATRDSFAHQKKKKKEDDSENLN